MRLFQKLLLSGLFISSAIACSPMVKNNYLKIGETAKTGKLSQTIHRLDYSTSKRSYDADENEIMFELEFTLHSDYESIVSLGGIYSYNAVFDDNPNNGGVYRFSSSSTVPSSIAPNANETVILDFYCFKDWKVATINYQDEDNKKYSFSIQRSDYQDYANNDYTVLKKNDYLVTNDGKAKLTFKSLNKTTIGSAGIDDNHDNLAFNLLLTSLVDEQIHLSSNPFSYHLECDVGFSDCRISNSSPTLPDVIAAKGDASLSFIIVVSKQWKKLIFGYDTGIKVRFTILHSDVSY